MEKSFQEHDSSIQRNYIEVFLKLMKEKNLKLEEADYPSFTKLLCVTFINEISAKKKKGQYYIDIEKEKEAKERQK